METKKVYAHGDVRPMDQVDWCKVDRMIRHQLDLFKSGHVTAFQALGDIDLVIGGETGRYTFDERLHDTLESMENGAIFDISSK